MFNLEETIMNHDKQELIHLEREDLSPEIFIKRIKALQDECNDLKKDAHLLMMDDQRYKNMISFQLGSALIQSKKSLRGLMTLPKRLVDVYRFSREKKKNVKYLEEQEEYILDCRQQILSKQDIE